MPRLLIILFAIVSLLPVQAQEPQLAVGQTFMLRIAEVPKAQQEQIAGAYRIGAYRIGAKGMVAFPYLKLPLPLVGLKPSEVEARITEAYHGAGLARARISIGLAGAPEELKLEGGETLTIRFSGIPREDIGNWGTSFTVSDSGEIKLPYLKPMQVTDCTPRQLSVKIAGTYRDQEIWSNLVVTVLRPGDSPYDQNTITIGGEVERAGEISFRSGLTLSEAIRQCGGPTEYSNLSKVKLFRGKGETLYDLRPAKNQSDPVLQQGDQIVVVAHGYFPRAIPSMGKSPSAAEPAIKVSGGVRHPGEVRYREGMNIYAAITLCGGFTDDHVKHLKLIRGKTERTIELKRMPTEPLKLQPGDEVVVPER